MRTWVIARLVLFAGFICFAAPLGVLADSTQVLYQVSNVSGNEWSYTYTVNNSAPFVANEALTVFFPGGLFSNLQDPPPSPGGWFTLSLQPDTTLLTDGLYTALALNDGASLVGPFTITFNYLGPGTPASQNFSIDLFDANGKLLNNVTTGVTTPFRTQVPEPATGLLLLVGAVAVSGLRKRFSRESS
jgi:hypothetical protein